MGKPHVLAVPFPAQGHVIPFMELAHRLALNGIRVTFVNTDFNHKRIMKAMGNNLNELIQLASIPDGLEPWEDRNDLGKLSVALPKVMRRKLEDLVEEINRREGYEVTCVVADSGLMWALEVAEKLAVKKSVFLTASVAQLAVSRTAAKLVDGGVIDSDGTPLKQQIIQLSPEMPAINSRSLAWTRIGDLTTQKIVFHSISRNMEYGNSADWIVCNSSCELEPGALKLVPRCLPIGPLLASTRLVDSAGHFWEEDSASLSWLDRQSPNSTIYVAFGSFTIFDKIQFQELALGLELTNRPFLWVVRQDMNKGTHESYPEAYKERIKNRGKIVDWAPQQKIISHPSVACFLSHCGWNSTVEGVSNGVPFLCWPYFADQFLNEGLISDYWKVGLSLDKDESGLIRQEEIMKKVEVLLTDEGYKGRALNLRSKVVSSATEGGSSRKNLDDFVAWIKKN